MVTGWPIYFKDKLIVDNLESNVGVATLWMPKESVAGELVSGSYSVCGQLYTKRGLNPMFRNILANSLIRYLVLCGVDRQGSGEALKKFFANGVAAKSGGNGELAGWKIIGDDEALLDKELSLEAFELIRKHVEFFDLRMKPLGEVAQFVASLKPKEAFGETQLFAEAESAQVNRFPSDMSVFKVKRDLVSDCWLDVLKVVNRFGAEIPGMYGKVKEVHNLCVVVEKEDPQNPKLPEYMKFGKNGLESYYKGFFNKNANRDETYTYGERIYYWDGIDQCQIMTDKLKKYPHDRGAMAVLWKPHKDNFPPQNTQVNLSGQTKGWRVPCLVMLLGQCIDDNFNMTAVFRSNDMYGAWPLNAFALRSFQQQLAKDIGKNLGSLTTISHVAEIYEIDWDDSVKTVAANDSLDRTCSYDARGYYTVKVENEDIVLTFLSPDGATRLAEFRENGKKPKVARDMCAYVLRDMLISEFGASMDLGRQLAKAETAIKLGLKFEQDQPLRA